MYIWFLESSFMFDKLDPCVVLCLLPLPEGKGSLGEPDATTDRQGFESAEEWKAEL